VFPGGAGTATGAGYYKANTQVSVQATPNQGFEFTGWRLEGNIIGSNMNFNYVVQAHASLTAIFQPATTGIESNVASEGSAINVYPNPASDHLMVELISAADQVRSVSLINTLGRIVKYYRVNDSGQNQISFDVRNLSPGLYVVLVDYYSGKVVKKIIMQ